MAASRAYGPRQAIDLTALKCLSRDQRLRKLMAALFVGDDRRLAAVKQVQRDRLEHRRARRKTA